MGIIDLTTLVRKGVSHMITVTNPLPTPVTLSTNCNISDISLPPTFIVGAQSEVHMHDNHTRPEPWHRFSCLVIIYME